MGLDIHAHTVVCPGSKEVNREVVEFTKSGRMLASLVIKTFLIKGDDCNKENTRSILLTMLCFFPNSPYHLVTYVIHLFSMFVVFYLSPPL